MKVAKITTLLALVIVAIIFQLAGRGVSGQEQKQLDPKAWGSNHVGKPVPEYIQDDCLFCHRNNIGPTWQLDAHAKTMLEPEAAPELLGFIKSESRLDKFLKDLQFFIGSRNHIRLAKKIGYGRLALLNVRGDFSPDKKEIKWDGLDQISWDQDKFYNKCAGCHATAVDTGNKTYTSFSLDCYTCHGDTNIDHTKDTSLILLSKKRRNDAKVITSLCAQCHLREGKSRSTGLPYPNNFIAGDNLFQDFEVDFSKADDANLNPGDRHIYRNVRDVVLRGDESITCLNCHQVHGNATLRHRRILRVPICSECHAADSFKNAVKYKVHSPVCEY
ncbi:MAG: hypothetical protein IPG76_14530 [Acidobacteria bacterium]|nr:hypothetical protein [Acidobacteriota bacterium]